MNTKDTAAESSAAATTAHTPAPWNQAGHLICGGRFGYTICQLSPASYMPGSITESDANARLIAAAPELLEALEALLECDTDDAGNGYEELTAPATYFARARAAIRKARGQ